VNVKRERATWREWWILALVLGLLAMALGREAGLGRADTTLYDAAIVFNERKARDDIVIVAIDEASLAQIGRWPWQRAIHAGFLQKLALAQPKAVALDLIFAETEPADELLARTLLELPTVLPVLIETRNAAQRNLVLSRPVESLARATRALGHIHLETDGDGIARSVFLQEGVGEARWQHFALALADAAGVAPAELPGVRNPSDSKNNWWRDYWFHIPFAGPPGSFATVSYADVLKGRVPPTALRDKLVLVGATASGLGDAYPVPVSGKSRSMPGVEISANVLDALLSKQAIRVADGWACAAFSAVLLLITLVGLRWLSPVRGLVFTAVMLLATLVLTWGLLRFSGLWMPPAAALLAIALAYPLWSWRRLEATIAYLGEEFRRLQSEPKVLPEKFLPEVRSSADLIEKRISAVESAAERLREARRFVSETLNSLPDAAVVTTPDGEVLLGNRAAQKHFGRVLGERLQGRSVGELLAGLRQRGVSQPVPSWHALAREGATVEVVSPDGEQFLLRAAACTGVEPESTAGYIVSLVNISELRAAEAQRDEILAFLSHDMRSPQSSILALLELHELDPENHPPDQVHKRIAQSARRTLDLSEQFLQLSRAESKQYDFEPTDLHLLVEDAVEEARPFAQQKPVHFKFDSSDDAPMLVRADRAMFTRALINLLTNAVKYSPENTETTIVLRQNNAEASVGVIDQGYGIAEADQARLFERYRRFSTPGQPKATGAGLGMAFVKTVIERHGGRISVTSGIGKGSSFFLHLPLEKAEG
jgi:CHASE2 domain-containing sensor protein/signal transduction histidine kinase